MATTSSNSPRTWDASCHVPYTYVHSDSSGGHKPDLLLQWEGLWSSWYPSCSPSTQEVWEKRLPVKTEAKKLLSYSSISLSVVTNFRTLFNWGYTFFNLFFLDDIPLEAHLVILCILCQVPLQLCLDLPHPIPTQLNCIPVLFPGYLSLLPLTVCFLLPLRVYQKIFL